MIKKERQDKILKILDERKYVTADELAGELFVSLPTVRRDLSELAQKHYIIRNHGGACRLDDTIFETPYNFRKAFMPNEKKTLCRAAAELIKNGDCIFIDDSSTTLAITDFLSKFENLTVVTSSIPVMLALYESDISVFGTGGRLDNMSYAFCGNIAEEALNRFSFDIAFFSARGITESGDVVNATDNEACVLRSALKRSKKNILLCCGDKFGENAAYCITHTDEVDFIVTDFVPSQFKAPIDKEKIIMPK